MFRPGTKKTFLILLFIALLAGVILFVIRLNKGDKVAEKLLPEITVLRLDVVGISKEELKLQAKVSLENHMPIGVSIDSIAYVVFIKGKEIARSLYAEKIDIKASGQSSILIPVEIASKKLNGLFEQLHKEGKDSTLMKIDLLLYSNLIPKDSTWVHVKLNIPVIVLPDIHVEHLKIHKLTASGAIVDATLIVANDNTMSFDFRDSKYKLILEDHKALEGVIPQTIKLPAKDSVRITIPLDLNFKQIGQTLGDLIRKGMDMKYDITVTTRPVTTIENFKDSDIILHAAGKLKTIKEATDDK